jgi:hypothetical protein
MAKLRRGGFIFLSWKGDHGPRMFTFIAVDGSS